MLFSNILGLLQPTWFPRCQGAPDWHPFQALCPIALALLQFWWDQRPASSSPAWTCWSTCLHRPRHMRHITNAAVCWAATSLVPKPKSKWDVQHSDWKQREPPPKKYKILQVVSSGTASDSLTPQLQRLSEALELPLAFFESHSPLDPGRNFEAYCDETWWN